MNFIRNNIAKIAIVLVIIIVLIVVVSSCSKRKDKVDVEGNLTGYPEIENRVQNAAIKYIDKNRELLPKSEDVNTKIAIDTLINNRYLGKIYATTDKSVTCDGYVEVSKRSANEYRYTPYIKCGSLYETKTIANYILSNEKVVNTGEGLYQNGTTYYYKGEFPKNYIKLGDDLFRIIEITEDGNLKLISTVKTIDRFVWDNRFNSDKQDYVGINDFKKSRLKESLELLYSGNGERNYISDVVKSYIVEHDFCVGRRDIQDGNIYSNSECKETYPLKVGLLYLSEYYKASTSSGCTRMGLRECNNYNYLFNLNPEKSVSYFTTLTAQMGESYHFYAIDNGNLITRECNKENVLVPVFYIDSDVIYLSGSGMNADPYVVR